MLGPLPPSVAAPSYWYAAEAVPNINLGGNILLFSTLFPPRADTREIQHMHNTAKAIHPFPVFIVVDLVEFFIQYNETELCHKDAWITSI